MKPIAGLQFEYQQVAVILKVPFTRMTCPGCDTVTCLYDCDSSVTEEAEHAGNRMRVNGGYTAIELLLGHLISSGVITKENHDKVEQAVLATIKTMEESVENRD